jgi:hypothetical protein
MQQTTEGKSMRKRVLLWTGMLVVLAGLGLAGLRWLLAPPPLPPGVNNDTFRRLAVGMTEQECSEILGPPLAKEQENKPMDGLDESELSDLPVGTLRWQGNDGFYVQGQFLPDNRLESAGLFRRRARRVDVQVEGRLEYRMCYETTCHDSIPRLSESVFVRFCRWLGL